MRSELHEKLSMNKQLRALIVEDSELDALLVKNELKRGGYDAIASRVDTKEGFLRALESEHWDLILCDHSMSEFDGLTALQLFKERSLDIPFIMVSATMTEDLVVKAMRAGAHDYVMKGHLDRLVPAIERELRGAEDRRERARTAAALNESELLYRSLFENMLDGYAYCKMVFENGKPKDFIYLDVNTKFEELTGLKDVTGKTVTEMIPGIENSNPEFFDVSGRVAFTGKPEKLETYVEPLGIWLSISTFSPRTGYFVAVFENITDRKRSEEALLESEAKYRQLVEQSPTGIFILDWTGRFLAVNKVMCEHLKFTEDEFLSMNVWEIVAGQYHVSHMQKLAAIMDGESTKVVTECEVKGKDGIAHSIGVYAGPYYEGKRIIGVQVIARDITERKRTVAALVEESIRRQILFEQSPEGIVVIDPHTQRIIDFNTLAHVQLGYSREEFAKLSIADVEANETREQIQATIANVIAKGRSDFETLQRTKGGEIRHVHVTAQYIDVSGKSVYYCFWRDITDRKKSEESLRKLNRAVEQSPVSIIITDTAGRIEYVNPRFSELTGYSVEEAVGRNPNIQKSGMVAPEVYADLWRKILAGDVWKGELINRKKNGELYWEWAIISPVTNDAGLVTHFVAVKEDITQRKNSERKLRESEELYRKLIMTVPDLIVRTDLDGNIVFINEPVSPPFTLLTKDRKLGRTLTSFIAEHEIPRALGNKIQILEGQHGLTEYTLSLEDGVRLNCEINGNVLRSTDGTPYGMVFVIRDITERKRAEEALRESENKYRLLVDNASEAIVVIQDGQLKFVNRATIGLMNGYSEKELTSRPFSDFIHPDDKVMVISKYFARMNGEPLQSGYVFRVIDRSGLYSWTEINTVLIEWEGRPATLNLLNNITDRKRAEETLRKSEKELSNALDIARLGPWEYDVIKDEFTFNDHFYRVFRVTAEQVGGYTMSSSEYARRFIPPDDVAGVGNAIRNTTESQDPNYSRAFEHRILYGDGSVGYISVKIFAVKDSTGRTIKTYGVNQDITERKHAEEKERNLEQQLLHAQRLESIGTLAAGIAHDLNNILNTVMGNIDLIANQIGDKEKLARRVQAIQKASQHGAQVVKQLLMYARKTQDEHKPVKVADLLQEVALLVDAAFPKSIDVELHLEPDVPSVKGDSSQLQQVLLNLSVNARDAMPAGGRLFIAAQVIGGEFVLPKFAKAEAPQYVKISVTDTGTGMDDEIRSRIFDPFYTTKEAGKGTGLGLAIVSGIVENHRGFIEVQSHPGQGSQFMIYLPVAE